MKKNQGFQERRKHARLPIMHGVLEPVNLSFELPSQKGKPYVQPAILSDLSAGGMRLMTFIEPPKTNVLEICFDMPGIGKVPIKGKVSWIRGKSGVYITGIAFTEISKQNTHKISAMAEDYEDCETRIALHLPESCVETCKCHHLCNKPQKDDVLFEETAPK